MTLNLMNATFAWTVVTVTIAMLKHVRIVLLSDQTVNYVQILHVLNAAQVQFYQVDTVLLVLEPLGLPVQAVIVWAA